MPTYKLEMLVQQPIGHRGEIKFVSNQTEDPGLVLSASLTLNNNSTGFQNENEKYTFTFFRDGEQITEEDLLTDYKKYYGLNR